MRIPTSPTRCACRTATSAVESQRGLLRTFIGYSLFKPLNARHQGVIVFLLFVQRRLHLSHLLLGQPPFLHKLPFEPRRFASR